MSQRWIGMLGSGGWVVVLACLAPAGCAVDGRTPGVSAGGAGGTSGGTSGSSGSAGSMGGSPSSGGTAGSGGSTAPGDCSNGADAGCTCLADGGLSCPPGCTGCSIEGNCISPGTTATDQPCLVCDPARSTSAWSNNDGAACEDAQFCTVEDSCLGGVCLAGGLRTCPTDEVCSNDACVPVPQPFVCEDPDPAAPFPVAVRDTGPGPAPEPEGGDIIAGTYTMTQVRLFGDFTSVRGEGLVLRGNYVHRNSTTYLASSGAALTGVRQIGTFTTTGTALAVDTENCGIAGSLPSIWGYTASGTQLELFKQDYGFLTIETYLLQP